MFDLVATERRLDAAVVATARALHERQLVVGSAGNVSVRRGPHVRITPTRTPYESLRRSDLVTTDASGAVIRGSRKPSLELPLHLAIYARRPDVGAIVHTHSPFATAWSFLGETLPDLVEEQDYYAVGSVRVSRPCRRGSRELAQAVVEALRDAPAALIGSHGVVAVGPDCSAALAVAETVEQAAHVAWVLRDRRDGLSARMSEV